MPGLLPDIDPDGLLEYSVVYTDRSVNHMSVSFQTVMNDISRVLGDVYNADAVVVVPGSGTFGMEAVARQFATGEHVLVVRNGWFSYRWTQIFAAGDLPATTLLEINERAIAKWTEPPPPPSDAEKYATERNELPRGFDEWDEHHKKLWLDSKRQHQHELRAAEVKRLAALADKNEEELKKAGF